MGEQTSLEFDLTFGDVLIHEIVPAYEFNMLRHTLYIIYPGSNTLICSDHLSHLLSSVSLNLSDSPTYSTVKFLPLMT